MTTSNDTAIDSKTTAIDDKKKDAFAARIRGFLPLIGFVVILGFFAIATGGSILTPKNITLILSGGYMLNKDEGESLADFLNDKVFAGMSGVTISPDAADVDGYKAYLERFKHANVAELAL